MIVPIPESLKRDLLDAFASMRPTSVRSLPLDLGKATAPITQEQLQQLMVARGQDAEAFADELMKELRFPVRQYAHRRSRHKPDLRDEATTMVFWHPMIVTDSQGKAEFEFELPDSITTYRILIDGHTSDGRIGSVSEEIESSESGS